MLFSFILLADPVTDEGEDKGKTPNDELQKVHGDLHCGLVQQFFYSGKLK